MKGYNGVNPSDENRKGYNADSTEIDTAGTGEHLDIDTAVADNDAPGMDKNSSDDETSERDSSVDVSKTINDMWKAQTKKNNLYLALARLSRRDIYNLLHKPNWDAIDPYSSLEEEFSDPLNKLTKDPTSAEEDNKPVIRTIYFMRDQKAKNEQYSNRPLGSTRKSVNYVNLDDNSDESSPKSPVKKPKVSLDPSADRIASKHIICATPGTPMSLQSPDADRSQRRFTRKDPSTAKPVHTLK